MESDETLESDHRGYLIDIDMVDYFSEELVERYVRKKINLNTNRKSHREVFPKLVMKC